MNSSATSIAAKSTPAGKASVGPQPKKPSRGGFPWMKTAFSILAILFLLLVYLQISVVSGTELNVQDWRLRKFSFRRDPFTNYQLSGVYHTAPDRFQLWTAGVVDASLDTSISSHLAPGLNERWDLVRFDQSTTPGDAVILVDLLSTTDASYQPFWSQWSLDNPRLAKVLWPAAQDLVQFGLYSELPQLLEFALVADNVESLQDRSAEILQPALLEEARRALDAGDSSLADQAAQLGLSYGDHPALQDFIDSLGN